MNSLNSFYGDHSRWFVGTVVNHIDPEARGRVQIRIHGIHSPNEHDIARSDLPWAETMLPVTEGGVSGIGRIPQLLNSAYVFGLFLDGKESQTPLVLGSLTHKELPSAVQQLRAAEQGNIDVFNPSNLGVNGTTISGDLQTAYAGGNATVDARRLILMRFFVENQISSNNTAIVAAGIVGNLEGENGRFDPGTVSGFAGENSQGLAQWNPAAGRLQQLQRFAAARGKPFDDFFIQCEFILHELRGSTIVAGDGAGTQSRVNAKLQRCTSFEGGPEETNATWIFVRDYERPYDARAELPRRQQFARRAYEQYTSALASAQPTDTSARRTGNQQ